MGTDRKTMERPQVWHAMSRGVRQGPIVFAEQDPPLFLSLLDWACGKTGVTPICHVLMENHYHLLADAIESQLSKAVQLLESRYAYRINLRERKTGSLFDPNYRHYPARNRVWIVQKSVYIHLNPVAGGLVEDLFRYRWSSADACIGGPSSLKTFEPSRVLDAFGKTRQEQHRNYREYLLSQKEACLRLHPAAKEVLMRYGDKELPSEEDVKIQLYGAGRLNQAIEEVVRETSMTLTKRIRTKSLLLSHLSRVWDTADANVTGAILVTSPANVRRYRRMAAERLARNPQIKDLIPLIESRLERTVT